MLEDLLAIGMSRDEIAKANELVALSKSLLRYYRDGGQPTFPRGYALLGLWCDRMGKQEHEAPLVNWLPSLRAQSQTLRQRCPTCGQTMRDAVLERWEQMDMHKAEHGGLPNWPPSARLET